MALSPRTRVLLLATLVFLALTALLWYLSSKSRPTPVTPITPPASSEAPPVTKDGGGVAVASPTLQPETTPPLPTSPPPILPPAGNNAPPLSSSPASPNAQTPGGAQTNAPLLIPVAGVEPEQLQDTFTQSRSEGRTHNAIDIIAARGTPIIAAAAGQIVKLFQSERGGITIYQLGTDNRTVYYYAHLERYVDGLAENRFVRRGETIGYLGDSGNSGAGNYHLHFSIWLVTDPKRYWDGENINPYPLLAKTMK
ncbi:MAG: M23 family metallopeptidase [Pyrinomonadaceae bacterium]